MKKILLLGKYYPPYFGGVEFVTKQCADALADRFAVVVLCHNDTPKTRIDSDGDVEIIRCGTQFSPFRQPISFLMAFHLARCKADLIHFHAPNFWAAMLIALFKKKTPLIVTHHADVEGRPFLRRALMPLYKHLLDRAVIVFVSSSKNALVSDDLVCDPAKIVAIPFGLNPDTFNRTVQERDRHQGEGSDSEVVFGFVGRFVWYKGIEVLLHALARTRMSRLVMVGDGHLRPAVEALISELRLQDRVILKGKVSEQDKIDFFKTIDVLVLPSTHKTETFGIVQVEAQMCGIPCIASNLPTGVSDIAEHGVTGLLVEPGDVASLERAMNRMIDDRAFLRSCSRLSRTRATDKFSEANFKRRFRAAVAEVITA